MIQEIDGQSYEIYGQHGSIVVKIGSKYTPKKIISVKSEFK